jgi:hypothetical protein
VNVGTLRFGVDRNVLGVNFHDDLSADNGTRPEISLNWAMLDAPAEFEKTERELSIQWPDVAAPANISPS